MSETTYRQDDDGNNMIDYINGEWATAYNVSDEDIIKMKENFDYDYIAEKYGWK